MKTKKAGTVLGLAGPGFVENTADPHKQTVIVALNEMSAIARKFNATLAQVGEDKHLTPAGRADRMAEALTAALTDLTKFDTEVKKHTDLAENIKKALLGKVVAVPKDVTPEVLREIRDQLREMTPEQRLQVFRTTDDPRVRAAIATAPPALGSLREGDKTRRFEPFVDPEELASAQMKLAEAADLGAATKMHSHRGVAEVFRLAAGSVRREMEEIAGVAV